MDAAQILKPFANEHIPADTKKTATAEHTSEIITMQNVNKSYKMGSGSLHVLKDISLTVETGRIPCHLRAIRFWQKYSDEYHRLHGCLRRGNL